MRTIFFCLFLSCSLLSCENKEQADPVKLQLDCYVRVLESESMILAEGTLKKQVEGSTAPQSIEVPGGLRFQGTAMEVLPNQGLTYHTEYKGEFRPDQLFSWDNTKSNTRHSFRLDMNDVKNYSFGSKTMTLGQPDTCVWEGAPLQQGETLVFMWENLKENRAVPIELYGAATVPMIAFPASVLQNKLSPGTWTLYIVRKKLQKGDANGVPAQAIMEFYAQTDTFTVVR